MDINLYAQERIDEKYFHEDVIISCSFSREVISNHH